MDIPRKRVVLVAGLLFLLALLITIFSSYHAKHMGAASLQYPLFLYGTMILSLVIGGFSVYLFETRIDTAHVEKFLKLLPGDERVVMRVLFSRKEVEQRKLVPLTGLTTVRVSRVLAHLEQRGVVEKRKQGYTNLVILKL